jgi:glycosyltransferase involved in cell wall biosynthesis
VLVGETGSVVSFGDVAGLARAIGQLVEMGADGRRRLGAAARARMAEQFSVERMCARYTELYEQLRAA